MVQVIVEASHERETEELGVKLGGHLKPGDVVALVGPLGAGKTCLVRGITRGLGTSEHVASPSFVLARQYRGRVGGERIAVHHLDAYRLASARELAHEDKEMLLDYLHGSGICLVEWADRLWELIPDERLEAHLEHTSEGRRITLVARGTRYEWLMHEMMGGSGCCCSA